MNIVKRHLRNVRTDASLEGRHAKRGEGFWSVEIHFRYARNVWYGTKMLEESMVVLTKWFQKKIELP